MNRKEGYYWVKHFDEWKIALWRKGMGMWKVFGSMFHYSDSELDEINETQILPPNN